MEAIEQTANKINQLHNELYSLLQNSLEKAIHIGELLAEKKQQLPHGHFGKWIKENLVFTDRTARNYMNLFKNKDKALEAGNIGDAYKLLEAPKTETVSEMKVKPLIGTGRLPQLVAHWYDQFAPYTILLDAMGWSNEEIAEELQQPQERISRVLAPEPHIYRSIEAEGVPPKKWQKAVECEISSQLSDMYLKAAEIAEIEGRPDLIGKLNAIAEYQKEKSDRLRFYYVMPFKMVSSETGEEIGELFDIAVFTLMILIMRDAVGIELQKFSCNWLLDVVDLLNDYERQIKERNEAH